MSESESQSSVNESTQQARNAEGSGSTQHARNAEGSGSTQQARNAEGSGSTQHARNAEGTGTGQQARGATEFVRMLARVLLGVALTGAGVAHLTSQRVEFQAQVPPWLPFDPDFVVVASGVVEVVLGLAIVFAPRKLRPVVGGAAALFFVAIFPGNIAQWIEGRDAFGLDTDGARFVRLFFQPVLVLWALWSTGAWRAWRARRV